MMRAVYHVTRDEFLSATLDEISLLSEWIPFVVGPGMNEQFGKTPRRRATSSELTQTARRAGVTIPRGSDG